MATTVTLANLRTAVRQRADMVGSQFVTDSELNDYINRSYAELYDLLIQKYGDNYFVAAPFSFSTDGSSIQYALPSDFYKLLGVDLALSNTDDSFVTVHQFEFGDRNRYSVPNFQSFYGVTNLRYRLNGNNLWLTPKPAANQTIRIWYIPRIIYLSADGDTMDGISGWEEYVIIDAAIKCLQKEESDISILAGQKVAIIQRIEAAAENRNTAQPSKVVDVMYNSFGWPSGNGTGDGFGVY